MGKLITAHQIKMGKKTKQFSLAAPVQPALVDAGSVAPRIGMAVVVQPEVSQGPKRSKQTKDKFH